MKRTHNCGELRKDDVGSDVSLAGWVDSLRHHGKVAFINLRDRYGLIQVVVKDKALLGKIKEVGHEWVLGIKGKIVRRPEGMDNPDLPTGEIDVAVKEVSILSKSKVPPFVITDEVKAKDELRLRYRYLDLRRYPMQETIIFKSHVTHAIREYLHEQDFVDIETPILGRSTPEGARDFLVPSRLNPGKFYSLTQSPQIYKQLLIIAGFNRYFQLPKCLRDEDQRKDRQLEHTQIDIEMAFINEENIFKIVEELMRYIFKKTLHIDITVPFERMYYKDALEKYGSDKPDTRYNILLKDISEIAKQSEFRVFRDAEVVKCIVWEANLSRKEIGELEVVAKGYQMGLAWLKYIDGSFSGAIAKYFNEELLEKFKLATDCTLLFVAGEFKKASVALGGVRNKLIEKYLPQKPKEFNFLWVTDFPMFEREEETNQLVPSHHVFVMPKDPKMLDSDPEAAIGKLYDLVLNGVELGSGSIRVHIRELQEKIMETIGFDKKRRERNFGCLLEALDYGAPPHGGIALGLDRIVMVMLGRKNIQDVIAFPKTLTGLGLLEGIPSEVEKEQLDEAHIKVKTNGKT